MRTRLIETKDAFQARLRWVVGLSLALVLMVGGASATVLDASASPWHSPSRVAHTLGAGLEDGTAAETEGDEAIDGVLCEQEGEHEGENEGC